LRVIRLGAPYEGGPLERLVWRLIGRTMTGEIRWTDDTQMALDTAESLIANSTVAPDDLASRFARSYRWNRGYGPGTAKVLKQIARGTPWIEASRAVYPSGSYGNGAAMRAAVVGLFYAHAPEAELVSASRQAAQVTHAHAVGIEGAVLLAHATAGLASGSDRDSLLRDAQRFCEQDGITSRLSIAKAWLDADTAPSPRVVRDELGNGVAAAESSVTALYIAFRFLDANFTDMQEFIVTVGGDVDTIGAMAGALWGAANGATRLPDEAIARLEQHERVRQTAKALHEQSRALESCRT